MNAEKYYRDISIHHEKGGMDAYVVDTSMENAENYLKSKGYSEASVAEIRKHKRVCIILGIRVDEEHRGEGIGTELLEEIIENASIYGSEIIILEADTSESNDFDLVEWYEGYEFKTIERERANYPLMLLDL